MPAEQKQGSPKEIPEGQMIGDDDPTVPFAFGGIASGQTDEVLHIEGKNGPAFAGGKGQLIDVGEAAIAGRLSGKNVHAPVAENPGESRIDVFIQVESDGHEAIGS